MFPAQALPDSQTHWIPPEEQLKRLSFPIAKKISHLPTALANIVAQGALDDSVANWYIALSRLNALPEKIPPLPEHIYQILDSKCPIYGDQRKADGTFHRVRDTHFLALVPEEFGSINRLDREILRPYGEREYAGETNPFQLYAFNNLYAFQNHLDTPFPPTHWVLMTKDILPESRDKDWNEEVALVAALSQKAFADYEIPTFQESFAAIMSHKAATGESLYQSQIGTEQNRWFFTYMRVQETSNDSHLMIGGFSPNGLRGALLHDRVASNRTGIAALRKF